MLGVNADEIEPLIYKQPDGKVEFFGTAVSPYYFSDLRRVSPRFLQQCGYQRAIWGLRCFSFDPFNRESLLSQCPICAAPLTAARAVGLFHCSSCRADLRDFPQDIVEIEDEDALAFVLSLVNPENSSFPNLPEDLAGLTKGEILALILTLGKLLNLNYNGSAHQKISTKTAHNNLPHRVLFEASAAVFNWRGKFFETAERLRGTKSYLSDKRHHPLTLGIPVSYKNLRRFVARELRRGSAVGHRTLHYFKSADGDLDEVVFKFPPSVTREVNAVGLPVTEILSLYRMGVVLCPDERLRDRLGLRADAPPLDLKAFDDSAVVNVAGSRIADIVLAARPSKHPWARTLSAIIQGEVKFSIRHDGARRLIHRIHSEQEETLNGICSTSETDVDGETLITSTKTESFYLSMSYERIELLKGAGILPKRKLRLRDIWTFQEEFISTAELRARARLAVGRLASKDLWMLIDAKGFRRVVPGTAVLTRRDGDEFLCGLRSRLSGGGSQQ